MNKDDSLTSPTEHAESLLQQGAREAREIGMTPSLLLQATLPHSDPGPIPVWSAKNGRYRLFIRSGFEMNEEGEHVPTGIPCGGLARLIIAYITTRVQKTGQQTISLGKTQTAFLDKLDLHNAGGEKGRIQALKKQLIRLAKAVITFEQKTTEGGGTYRQGENIPFVRKYNFWELEESIEQREGQLPLRGSITLDAQFKQEIIGSSVAVDMRMLKALRGAPLAMDLYTWITYKQAVRWKKTEIKPLYVSWKALEQQFGSDYGETKEFARHAKRYLERISKLWPDLKYETPRGRLKLPIFPPHVSSSY